MGAWALVDWDNTIRPGFVMIDWVECLAGHDLIPPALTVSMREHERAWQEGKERYQDFIQYVVSAYRRAESMVDPQLLRDLAGAFVSQDTSFLTDGTVGSTLLQLFQDFNIKVHVVSGAPLVILREYQRRHDCIKRVTGISSEKEVYNLFELKRDAALMYASNPALFGIGDSETDIPLFEGARHPIGINFAPAELFENGGISVCTGADLMLAHEVRIRLSSYISKCHGQRSCRSANLPPSSYIVTRMAIPNASPAIAIKKSRAVYSDHVCGQE